MKSTTFTICKQHFEAVIFDLDGVVTKTARIHAAVWKKLFDEYGLNRNSNAANLRKNGERGPGESAELASKCRRWK
jgi:beta-phosphoglucomutase-like phosphatase (HAD superfamily)